MSGVLVSVGVLVEGMFEVYDSSNAPVLGLVKADFTVLLAYEGAGSAIAVAVTEVGNGRYLYSFTPNAAGDWYVSIRHATYNARGWSDEFQARSGGSSAGGVFRWMYENAEEDGKLVALQKKQREWAEANRAAIAIAVLEAVDAF